MYYLKNKINRWMLLSLAFVMVCFTGCYYTLELSQDVKIYCQKTGAWCGAASTQMILNSYPDPAECVFKTQQEIMNKICDMQSAAEPCKDPAAVKDAIMELDSPASSAHWAVFSKDVKSELMYSIMYWMAKREYPAATIRSGNHWVVVIGFDANADPLLNSDVELQFITINDPLPFCNGGGNMDEELTGAIAAGHIRGVSADTWYDDTQYWGNAVSLPGWSGKYVAVIEPPKAKGRATAPKEYVGTEKEIISPERALQSASEWVKKLNLPKRKYFRFFKELSPLPAMLVHSPESRKHYYLVPFGLKKEGPAKGWLIINAYNGRFQEVGGYKTPFTCLSSQEAIKIALKKAKIEKYEKTKADLVFHYSLQSYGRHLPIWQVTIDETLLYVIHDGKAFKELTPPPC